MWQVIVAFGFIGFIGLAYLVAITWIIAKYMPKAIVEIYKEKPEAEVPIELKMADPYALDPEFQQIFGTIEGNEDDDGSSAP